MAAGNERSGMIAKGKSLAWTEEEIVIHYRSAKDQKAIIGILADLNNVTEKKIKKVLSKHGIETGADKESRKKHANRAKELKKRAPKVYTKLVSGGVSYSIMQVARKIGRSMSFVKNRIGTNSTVVLGGMEYQVMRYDRRCKDYYKDMDGGI